MNDKQKRIIALMCGVIVILVIAVGALYSCTHKGKSTSETQTETNVAENSEQKVEQTPKSELYTELMANNKQVKSKTFAEFACDEKGGFVPINLGTAAHGDADKLSDEEFAELCKEVFGLVIDKADYKDIPVLRKRIMTLHQSRSLAELKRFYESKASFANTMGSFNDPQAFFSGDVYVRAKKVPIASDPSEKAITQGFEKVGKTVTKDECAAITSPHENFPEIQNLKLCAYGSDVPTFNSKDAPVTSDGTKLYPLCVSLTFGMGSPDGRVYDFRRGGSVLIPASEGYDIAPVPFLPSELKSGINSYEFMRAR